MKIKSIIAIIIAGIMVMSVPMVAMADEHKHNGSSFSGEEPVNSVTANDGTIGVKTDGNGTSCAVTGAVTATNKSAIDAVNGSTVTAGSATNGTTNVQSDPTVQAKDTNTKVNIEKKEGVDGATGAVINNGDGTAIKASDGAKVTADSATNTSSSDATVNVDGDSSNDNDGTYDKTYVTIKGDVTNNGTGSAVEADDGAVVVIEGTAKSNGADATKATVYVDDTNSKVIVYKIENTDTDINSKLVDGNGAANVYYIIKGTDSAGISNVKGTTNQTVLPGTADEKTYKTAQYGEEIKVYVASGYEVKAGSIEVTKNADGTYSVTVPEGGGVTLEAIMKAVQKAQSTGSRMPSFTNIPIILGTQTNPITGGEWKKFSDGVSYWYNGTMLVNTLAWIKTEKSDGTSTIGRYYFGKAGNMRTGWQKVGNKWYCFNPASGELLVGWVKENDRFHYIDTNEGWEKTQDENPGTECYNLDENVTATPSDAVDSKELVGRYKLYAVKVSDVPVLSSDLGYSGYIKLNKDDSAVYKFNDFREDSAGWYFDNGTVTLEYSRSYNFEHRDGVLVFDEGHGTYYYAKEGADTSWIGALPIDQYMAR